MTSSDSAVVLQQVCDPDYLNTRFVIREKSLGRGGYGKVFLIQSDALYPERAGKSVVKVSRHSQYLVYARLEVEAHGRVNGHPYIACLQEALTRREMHASFIFIEYAEKGSLYEVLHYDPGFAERSGRMAMLQLLDAVSYCHRRGVLHLDVATTNVFVRASDSICLGDFGASSITEINDVTRMASAFHIQEEMTVLQSRAPEVLLSNVHLPGVPGLLATTATDIWGVGCVMAEMFRGFVSLQGPKSASSQLSVVLMLSDPRDVGSWGHGLPIVEMHKQTYPTLKIGSARDLALAALRTKQPLNGGGIELMTSLLSFNPEARPSADVALQAPWLSAMTMDATAPCV